MALQLDCDTHSELHTNYLRLPESLCTICKATLYNLKLFLIRWGENVDLLSSRTIMQYLLLFMFSKHEKENPAENCSRGHCECACMAVTSWACVLTLCSTRFCFGSQGRPPSIPRLLRHWRQATCYDDSSINSAIHPSLDQHKLLASDLHWRTCAVKHMRTSAAATTLT